MKALPWIAQLYIVLLTALMISAVLFSVAVVQVNVIFWITIILGGGLIAALDVLGIRQFGVQVEISISNAVKFALLLLAPPAVVIIAVLIGTLIGEIYIQRVWFKKLFNLAEMTLTWTLTSALYFWLYDPHLDYFGSVGNVLALVSTAILAYSTNTILVCMVISLAARLPLAYVLKQNIRGSTWHEASLFTLGIFLAVLWRFNPLSVVLAAVPLFVVRHSYQTANHLQNQTQEALRALVRVVDERDHHTHNHSENVSSYARRIAMALDVPQEEIEVIAFAALLHDLGKIGMADDILFNPKLLNSAERHSAEQHAEIGAMLLSKFPLFNQGAVLVRHHHERIDGTGYPGKLKGETIPLGSRIIAIADAYQAMTEDRPYRRALDQADAIARLVEGSGTQFDAHIVRVFAKILGVSIEPSSSAASSPPAAMTPLQT